MFYFFPIITFIFEQQCFVDKFVTPLIGKIEFKKPVCFDLIPIYY